MALGEKGEFSLALRGYIPPIVRCIRTVPRTRPVLTDCQRLIGDMNVLSWPLRFGARGAHGVQEVLPKTLSMFLLSSHLGFVSALFTYVSLIYGDFPSPFLRVFISYM